MDRRGEGWSAGNRSYFQLATLKLVEPNIRRILAAKLESQY